MKYPRKSKLERSAHAEAAQRKKVDRYLDVARNAAARTGAIAVLWLLIVTASWWSVEHQIQTNRMESVRIAREYSAANDSLRSAVCEVRQYRNLSYEETAELEQLGREFYCESSEAAARTAHREEVEARFKNAAKAHKDKQLAFENARSKVVTFRFPGFPQFDVDTSYAPVLLSIVILVLAFYLTFMRERAFHYLARAIRLSRRDLKMSMEAIGDVLAPKTWWVAPLPHKDGESVTAEEFATAVGWRSPRHASALWVGLLWLWLLVLQLRLTYLGTESVGGFIEFKYLLERSAIASLLLLQMLYFFVTAMTAALAIWWLRGERVPDEIVDPGEEMRISRRRVLHQVGLASIAPLALNSYAANVVDRLFGRQPRFRRLRTRMAVTGPDGLRLNPASSLIHLAREGYIVGVRSGIRRLEPVDPGAIKEGSKLKLAKSSSASAEHAANELFSSNRVTEGFELLMNAITRDFASRKQGAGWRFAGRRRMKQRKRHRGRPLNDGAATVSSLPPRKWIVDLRLYDLLASASVRLQHPEALAELTRFIASDSELSYTLNDRLSKWASAQWQQRVSSSDRSSNGG